MRKHANKTERDPREIVMPDPSLRDEPEDWEVVSARELRQRIVDMIDNLGTVQDDSLLQAMQHAWGRYEDSHLVPQIAHDLLEVVIATDSEVLSTGDIITTKSDFYRFGVWLIGKKTATSVQLYAIDTTPVVYDEEHVGLSPSCPLNIPLGGHPGFGSRCVLADLAIEVSTTFVDSGLFQRVGWASLSEIDEVEKQAALAASPDRLLRIEHYDDLDQYWDQASCMHSLQDLWRFRQQPCTCRR